MVSTFRLEFCRWHQNSENQPAFSQLEMSAVPKIALVFFYRFLCCAGAATQVSNFRFIKFKTLKWTIPSLSDLEFAEQKEKAMITVTRRYVIKTNHCELSWQPTAAVAKQGQVSFFTFFFSIWSNEHDACLIIRGMNGCMYLAREKSYLCFFLDESGFCWFAHPVIEIEHQWPTD